MFTASVCQEIRKKNHAVFGSNIAVFEVSNFVYVYQLLSFCLFFFFSQFHFGFLKSLFSDGIFKA